MRHLLISFVKRRNHHIAVQNILTSEIAFATDYLSITWCFSEENMSINSINHDEMTNIENKWDAEEEVSFKPETKMKSAEARRRIEALREIRESGLSLEEARELGLIH